jgi:hypothetical protein
VFAGGDIAQVARLLFLQWVLEGKLLQRLMIIYKVQIINKYFVL